MSILSIRFWWRPPSKEEERKTSMRLTTSSKRIVRPPNEMMFALLCFLAISAVKESYKRAALMPLNLFAAIEMPTPVPQIKIPKSALRAEMCFAILAAKSG